MEDFDIQFNEQGEKVLVKCNIEEGMVIVPDDIVHIDYKAFAYSGIENVVLPDGLKTIGKYAFYSCENLKEVAIPEGVEEIPKSAFFGCKQLSQLVLPKGLKVIGKEAFWNCSGLTQLTLPEGLEEIGQQAFHWCDDIKTVIIPQGVKRIGEGAFGDPQRVYIPDSVEVIEEYAFGCGFHVTFYCQGQPKEGWVDEPDEVEVYYTDESYSFNFHRSAGSFDREEVRHENVKHHSYNPQKRPVYTFVSLEEFLKLTKED